MFDDILFIVFRKRVHTLFGFDQDKRLPANRLDRFVEIGGMGPDTL
jgi:hypothetical protein